ncbi:uncharacterized protein [Lolium perenne]|uniref:uncharacterized protein n=1 Tax=Lolium perenne TaxID=4522 RepID=UPI0021F69304|nr:uncharacterized protein LOC127306723 [Lolium perenne]
MLTCHLRCRTRTPPPFPPPLYITPARALHPFLPFHSRISLRIFKIRLIARSIDPIPVTALSLRLQASTMVAGFRRTISFPAPRSSSSSAAAAAAGSNGKSAQGYRVRSASLPCRFHPLVLQLDEDVSALRDLAGPLASAPTARAIGAAAEQLGRVLASLSDLLHHPLAQDPLRRLARSPLAERLLDDFLRLADAHGSFRSALVALAALQAEARAALRREDAARLASAARGLRRSGRDLPRIASAARAVATKAPPPAPAGLPSDAAALAAAVVDAAAAVASASAAVFSGVSALSVAAATARVDVVGAPPCWMPSPARFASSTPRAAHHHHHVVVTTRPSSSMRVWWVADLMRWMSRAKRRSATKQHNDAVSSNQQPQHDATAADVDPEEEDRKAAFDRMDNLGRCIADVEGSGEQVFRALVNTRVSLLNILSPTI